MSLYDYGGGTALPPVDPPKPSFPPIWKGVAEGLERIEVPGGWLYRLMTYQGVALAFVPAQPAPYPGAAGWGGHTISDSSRGR